MLVHEAGRSPGDVGGTQHFHSVVPDGVFMPWVAGGAVFSRYSQLNQR
jgi:hypothetical protein